MDIQQLTVQALMTPETLTPEHIENQFINRTQRNLTILAKVSSRFFMISFSFLLISGALLVLKDFYVLPNSWVNDFLLVITFRLGVISIVTVMIILTWLFFKIPERTKKRNSLLFTNAMQYYFKGKENDEVCYVLTRLLTIKNNDQSLKNVVDKFIEKTQQSQSVDYQELSHLLFNYYENFYDNKD